MVTQGELLKGKHINQVSFRFGFSPIMRIEKYMYDLDNILKELFPDEVVDTKVPYDFDPTAPRCIHRDVRKKRFLEVALDSALFKLELTKDYSTDMTKGIDYFKSKCKKILNGLTRVLDPTYENFGGVFLIQYSLGTDFKEENFFFADKFLNKHIEKPKIYKFQLTYVEKEKYYLNYAPSGYTSYSLDIKHEMKSVGQAQLIRINPETHPSGKITDKGVQVKLDINNLFLLRQQKLEKVEIDEPDTTIDDIFDIAQKSISELENFIL